MTSTPKLERAFWQDSERSKKILHLLDTGLLSDCKFLVGPDDATAEIIIGHKLLFVLESPVLEQMLGDNFDNEKEDIPIRIEDIHPEDFKNFRYMIYNNDPSQLSKYSLEEIMELCRISHKYMVLSILRVSIQFLISSLKSLNRNEVIIMYEFAAKLEERSLQVAVEKEICLRKPIIMADKLYELSSRSFYAYLVFVSELSNAPKAIQLFRTVDVYLKRSRLLEKEEEQIKVNTLAVSEGNEVLDINNIHHFKIMLLKLVRFNEMTPAEFISGPGKSDIIEIQYKYDLLTSICTKYSFP